MKVRRPNVIGGVLIIMGNVMVLINDIVYGTPFTMSTILLIGGAGFACGGTAIIVSHKDCKPVLAIRRSRPTVQSVDVKS